MTLDEQLTKLEEDIRRLKVEFDIFFNGGSKRPPYDTKGRIEATIKRLSEMRSMKYSHRFRFNSLCARYNCFRDLWRRTLQEREEGISPTRRPAKPAVPESAKSAFTPIVHECSDPQADPMQAKRIFDTILDAKRMNGEPTDKLSFSVFQKLIAEKTAKIKSQAGCSTVQFAISIEDGQVKLRAKGIKK